MGGWLSGVLGSSRRTLEAKARSLVPFQYSNFGINDNPFKSQSSIATIKTRSTTFSAP